VSGAGDQGHACVWQPLASGRDLRVEIDATPVEEEPAHRAVIEEAWERIRAANPRAFNGPILAYLASGPENNLVVCRRDEYRRLAVLPEIETGLVQLGVTGVLEARDEAGTRHVLLGLRSHATRVFGGMWEFGPSGGVDPPPVGQASMDADDIWRVLINEIREEVGLPVDPDPTPPLGLLHEPVGRSCELVVRVSIRRPVEELIALIDRENRTSRWEYDAVRWVAVDELGAFVDAHPAIPSALALAELVPSWV
jgi:8-oxo-dGTP pyrophosphatase MutT (NUDIX family)